MATQWPLLVDRLVALLPTLPSWSTVLVTDGPPVTDAAPSSYCMVGFVDDDFAGSYGDDLSSMGNTLTSESGEIRCRLVVVDGGTDVATVRTTAFELVDEFRDSLRADPRLGVLPAGSVTALTVNVGVAQNSQGVGQWLDLTLTYTCPVF